MLSILIPSYNHAAYIEDAILCALEIDVTPKRIVVIDDASTDGTSDVVRKCLADLDSDLVKFISKKENRGLVDTINTFLTSCESDDTEFVYMIASDDLVIPEGVTSLVARLRQERHLQFIIGGGYNIFSNGNRTPIYGAKHEALFRAAPSEILQHIFTLDYNPILIQSSVFRLSAIRDIGGLDEDIVSDDFALFGKLFSDKPLRGRDFEFLPEVKCVLYRHHGSNSYRNLLRQAQTVLQVLDRLAPADLRSKANGYKISFFVLMALRGRSPNAALGLLKLTKLKEIPWLIFGLFANMRHWLAYRNE